MPSLDQPKVVKIGIIFMLAFSFALCISAFVSARQCYVVPCFQGNGLEEVWSVDGGQSFQLVGVSLLAFSHVFVAYWILFKASYDEVKYGMLVASTGVLSALLLCQAVYWGQQGMMIKDLEKHVGGGALFEDNTDCDVAKNETACIQLKPDSCQWTSYFQCQRVMVINSDIKAKFDAVTVFSVILSLTQAGFAYMLLSWRKEFGEIYGATPAGPKPGAARLSQRAQVSPPAEEALAADTTGNASYQTTEDHTL